MVDTRVKRGELFFLLHPGEVQFSGYGLTVGRGSINRLVGLLMVDRPCPVSQEWLDEIKMKYGGYELYPMTQTGERGIACQMWIVDDSVTHVRQLPGSYTRLLQEALLPLLVSPPKPQLKVSWDNTVRLWRSEFYEALPGDRPKRRTPLFPLGQVVATPGALSALEESGQLPQEFLHRHVAGDWGQLDEHDLRANEQAVREGQRILSAYSTKNGVRLWIITEWDRSVTTLLLPSEY